jgi:hypothetical protein
VNRTILPKGTVRVCAIEGAAFVDTRNALVRC